CSTNFLTFYTQPCDSAWMDRFGQFGECLNVHLHPGNAANTARQLNSICPVKITDAPENTGWPCLTGKNYPDVLRL
ncbi:hypothetical protein QP123_12055, partial [Streptococcus agalactiae]